MGPCRAFLEGSGAKGPGVGEGAGPAWEAYEAWEPAHRVAEAGAKHRGGRGCELGCGASFREPPQSRPTMYRGAFGCP